MQQTFFLSKYSGWKELPATLIYPINATYGIDGGTDTMEFSFYGPQDFDLPLDTPIKVVHDDDIRYFVVKDCKFSDMQYVNLTTQKPERIFTVSLCEPFELLRGYRLQACKFSPNRYTVENCIMRMFTLANFNCGIDIPNPNNVISNVLEFASTTLYLAIYEVARTQDCIPYLEFNETTQGSWILKFQHLDGLNETVYTDSIFKNPLIQKQNIGEGIAKKVYVENSNLKIPLYTLQRVLNPIAVDNSNTITINNFGIKLESEMNGLRSISIFTNGYSWLFTNNNVIDYVALFEGTYYEETRTIKLLSKVNYDNLTTKEKNENDVIYIYYEDNIIYMNDLKKLAPTNFTATLPWGEIWGDSTFALQKVKGNANELVGRIHDFVTPLWLQEFQVYAQVTITKTIPFLAYNNSDYDDTTFYNQNAKAVDPVSMERVLQTYIDNMQSGTLLRSGVFNHYYSIPQEGSIIISGNKNYIVNSLTVVDNSKYYDVTFALVEYHAKRREYLEANTDIQIEDITSNDLIPSFNLKPYLIKYSIIDQFEQKRNYDFKTHKGIVVPRNDGKQLYNAKMELQINSSGTSLGLAFRSNVDYITYNNSVSFYATAENNFTWKDAVDNNGNLIPQTYVNKAGEIIDTKISLVGDDGLELVKFELDGTNNYPIKDRMEVFTITNQYTYKGVNNTVVAKDFINWLINANAFQRLSVYIYNKHIGPYDDRTTDYVAKSEANVSIDTTNQSITLNILEMLEGEFKSVVITDQGGSRILFVKNYIDTQVNFGGNIPIYYSIEDGLPVQTAVRPYDYEN